ncbi:Perakine reductase [Camellia lanceoleosa]|uniref:Perakine reductase n=1 Tax=Camellia lanceoleosa TaxID=1840588 RepID=A0ACC0IG22_9ERIC|nr:Perakine reductase [Camellia lanceoleosa]
MSGLAQLARCTYRFVNKIVVSSFVERWQPETNTFHLTVGEMTITLDDVATILGLPIVGKSISVRKLSERRATNSVGLIGIPIIKSSVDRLNTLHQPRAAENFKALKDLPREKVQLATKFGIVKMEPTQVVVKGTVEYVRSYCEASLKRLGVDYIDLYYIHRIDKSVPIEETMWGAMGDMKVVDLGSDFFLGNWNCDSSIFPLLMVFSGKAVVESVPEIASCLWLWCVVLITLWPLRLKPAHVWMSSIGVKFGIFEFSKFSQIAYGWSNSFVVHHHAIGPHNC